jgi:protein-tyrosine-phosphatase
MAEAFVNHYGKGKIIASSAGVRLAERINPIVVGIMKEKGIDISSNKPKLLSPRMVEEADQVVTMGCSVEKFCPAPLFKKPTDWNLEDPKGKPIEKIREIRDEIEKKVKILITEIN